MPFVTFSRPFENIFGFPFQLKKYSVYTLNRQAAGPLTTSKNKRGYTYAGQAENRNRRCRAWWGSRRHVVAAGRL
jgi:hypothetical protein